MASTAKSQPLHNFNLPRLGGHPTGHHQRRRSIKSPSRRPSASPSPLRDPAATPPRYQSPLREPPPPIAQSEIRSRNQPLPSTNPHKSKSKPKMLIKIPLNNKCNNNSNKSDDEINHKDADEGDDDPTDEAREEISKINNNNSDEETKIWNLRPRKPMRKPLNVNGGLTSKTNHKSPNNKSGESEKKAPVEKKEKRKLSVFISLSKEEIEEDIYSLTGSKPARRPKKRAKIVQKQVDSVFPGLWLLSINADSYKVSENSLKG